MDGIIEQIKQIDSVAFENMKKNEQFLLAKKQEYENIIINYRNERIALANFTAEQINKSIEESLKKQEMLDQEKIKKVSSDIEEKYLQIEEELISKIFNKLFVLEG